MLLHNNYTAEHIANLRAKTEANPFILERTVFAFGLLEAIRSVDMPFIFKGGTSLLVMYTGRLSERYHRQLHILCQMKQNALRKSDHSEKSILRFPA